MSLFGVRDRPLLIDDAIAAVAGPDRGGINIFLGTVRDHNDGQQVNLLEYHAYEAMAEKQMQKIAAAIEEEIPGCRLSALHRIGSLKVGDTAVICVAAAPHRDEAFRACRLLIDRIKADVPIWKREHGPDGPYWIDWQDARCSGHNHN
ncbi:MAG: molybdenum cofactor biosynthesis protein MoaE [Polyangiaceae bacterium]|nr:molybdenum cofactor biosynthesis protein MoaE [Polyangiaceae bacterium]